MIITLLYINIILKTVTVNHILISEQEKWWIVFGTKKVKKKEEKIDILPKILNKKFKYSISQCCVIRIKSVYKF